MSKHNYSQYSSKKYNNSDVNTTIPVPSFAMEIPETVVEPEMAVIPELTPEVVDTPEVKMESKVVTGVVAGCARLNVRAESDIYAEIVGVLNAKTELLVDLNKSTDEWFSVCTASGVEGYCMKKFVDIRL